MPVLNITKLANAFVPRAVTSAAVGGVARGAVERYGAAHGGLWVGGKVTIAEDGVRFVPNGLNKAMHVGLESTHIPLADIQAARRVFGVVTGIVIVTHARGEFRFRCFGARGVAQALAARLASMRG